MLIHNKQGQTMIEAIIAVAIIAIALVGFLSRSTQSYIAISESINRNLALNLAREGVEVVRNTRDSNWLKGCFDPADGENCVYWNTYLHDQLDYRFITYISPYDGEWTLKSTGMDFDDCQESEMCRLYLDEQGFYSSVESDRLTNFYRMVENRPICESKVACGGDGICASGQSCPQKQIGIQVVSRVRWKQGSDWRNVSLVDSLYNWR